METLIFALIASYNAHRQQKPVVAGPEEFQPFDLQYQGPSDGSNMNTRSRPGSIRPKQLYFWRSFARRGRRCSLKLESRQKHQTA
jgi:hypothetical protein